MTSFENAALRDYPVSFSENFVSYCRAHHLPPQLFHDLRGLLGKMPRYVRLRPEGSRTDTTPAFSDESSREGVAGGEEWRVKAGVAASLGVSPACVEGVGWLPRPYCFAVPRDVAVCRSAAYRRGRLSAMDAASVAAVVALRPCPGDHVWDVCCSPGMKLSLIADAIGATGVAVGTDISLNRLFTARSVLKKHQTNNACLFAADGSSFSLHSATMHLDQGELTARYGSNGLTAWEERRVRRFCKRQCVNDVDGSAAVNETAVVFLTQSVRKKLEHLRKFSGEHHGFDRVIVDAECSHDGSLAHMCLDDATKRPFSVTDDSALAPHFKGIDNEHRMQLLHLPLQDGNVREGCKENTPSLQQLQLDLLKNGYAQLKPGGTLVYCTCSFTYRQNEFIVREFVRLVNLSHEVKQKYKGEAVLCHPFAYMHETVSPEAVSPLVRLTDAQTVFLQERLKADDDPYGIVAAGEMDEGRDENNRPFTGVRFWPHTFATSFQFIAKVWKRPLQP